jgi:serine/threonine protein kinase
MELVPGPTLADRLAAGPLAPKEALEVCRQVAEALEAAHAQGVIHRDLKPANIKVTPQGRVKVLDFGLAKALLGDRSEPDFEESPTITRATRDGVALGTPGYMSPEQARGQEQDKRTDVWSFGCVLYEALTGRRAFSGGTASDTLVAVLSEEPDWAALPSTTPAGVRTLLQRCLRKDAENRLHDMADARIELEEGALGALTLAPASRLAPAPLPRGHRPCRRSRSYPSTWPRSRSRRATWVSGSPTTSPRTSRTSKASRCGPRVLSSPCGVRAWTSRRRVGR